MHVSVAVCHLRVAAQRGHSSTSQRAPQDKVKAVDSRQSVSVNDKEKRKIKIKNPSVTMVTNSLKPTHGQPNVLKAHTHTDWHHVLVWQFTAHVNVPHRLLMCVQFNVWFTSKVCVCVCVLLSVSS